MKLVTERETELELEKEREREKGNEKETRRLSFCVAVNSTLFN